MARTESTPVPLGTVAPDLRLLDTNDGNYKTLDDLKKSGGLLLIFMCNHCPYVKHILPEMRAFIAAYKDSSIGMAAISSNDVENYPDDSPEEMARLDLGIPYLYDETQEVAKAYDAVCTPEFYLFDAELKLVYHGQFDDARPGNDEPVTGSDLREAMNAVIEGKRPNTHQHPGMGCNIKWKPE